VTGSFEPVEGESQIDKILALRPDLEVIDLGNGSISVHRMDGHTVDIGSLSPARSAAVDSIDGSTSLGQLTASVRDKFGTSAATDVEAWIELLIAHRIVVVDPIGVAKLSMDEEAVNRHSAQLRWFSVLSATADDAVASLHSLFQTRVCIVGLGGIGSLVALLLANSGIGLVRIVDSDIVESGNLPRQFIYDLADIGRSKAISLREHIQERTEFVSVEAVQECLDTERRIREVIADVDVVVLTGDNPRYIINRRFASAAYETETSLMTTLSGSFGPMYIPYRTACFACAEAEQRRRIGSKHDQIVSSIASRDQPSYPATVTAAPYVAAGIVDDIVGYASGIWTPLTANAIVKIGRDGNHRVEIRRDPRCPICSVQRAEKQPARGTACSDLASSEA